MELDLPANGMPMPVYIAISLANSTNLQDFINLNGTTDANGNTGAPTSKLQMPAAINENLFGTSRKDCQHWNSMFNFTVSNGNVVLEHTR